MMMSLLTEGPIMSDWPRRIFAADFYRYACAESSVGRLLIVMTETGVVDVVSGDSRQELLSAAMARHPGFGFMPDRGEHAHWVAAVVRRIEKQSIGASIPVDLDARRLRRTAG